MPVGLCSQRIEPIPRVQELIEFFFSRDLLSCLNFSSDLALIFQKVWFSFFINWLSIFEYSQSSVELQI